MFCHYTCLIFVDILSGFANAIGSVHPMLDWCLICQKKVSTAGTDTVGYIYFYRPLIPASDTQVGCNYLSLALIHTPDIQDLNCLMDLIEKPLSIDKVPIAQDTSRRRYTQGSRFFCCNLLLVVFSRMRQNYFTVTWQSYYCRGVIEVVLKDMDKYIYTLHGTYCNFWKPCCGLFVLFVKSETSYWKWSFKHHNEISRYLSINTKYDMLSIYICIWYIYIS